jgi:alpha-tubulin suppressor-like RCC1 family protein
MPATGISVGGAHACAVHATGAVSCWGDDTRGALGDGTPGEVTTTPVAVRGITTASQVSCGLFHTCALLGDGTVTCWGAGTFGELGNGRNDSADPLPVPGVSNAAEIRAGMNCTCAREAGGVVRCWGDNRAGCLGRDSDSSSTPSPVTAPRDFERLFEGNGGVMCGVRAGGIVQCWGALYGRVPDRDGGVGTTTPVERTEYDDVLELAVSLRAECALFNSGVIACRGSNFYGQLGDGTAVSRDSLVSVQGLP